MLRRNFFRSLLGLTTFGLVPALAQPKPKDWKDQIESFNVEHNYYPEPVYDIGDIQPIPEDRQHLKIVITFKNGHRLTVETEQFNKTWEILSKESV